MAIRRHPDQPVVTEVARAIRDARADAKASKVPRLNEERVPMAVFRRKTAEMSPYEKKEAVKTERGAADVARMLGLPEPKRKGPKWMS